MFVYHTISNWKRFASWESAHDRKSQANILLRKSERQRVSVYVFKSIKVDYMKLAYKHTVLIRILEYLIEIKLGTQSFSGLLNTWIHWIVSRLIQWIHSWWSEKYKEKELAESLIFFFVITIRILTHEICFFFLGGTESSAHNTIKRRNTNTHTKKIRRCMEYDFFLDCEYISSDLFTVSFFVCCVCSLCFGQLVFLDRCLLLCLSKIGGLHSIQKRKTKIKNELNDKLHNIPCNYSLFIIRPILLSVWVSLCVVLYKCVCWKNDQMIQS